MLVFFYIDTVTSLLLTLPMTSFLEGIIQAKTSRERLLLILRIRSAHLEILGFLWVVQTNTGIFLRALKLCGESRT